MDRLPQLCEITVGFSEGYIAGDKVVIAGGSFKAMGRYSEGQSPQSLYIPKFNIMGRDRCVKVGLEIVSELPDAKQA